jgi:hypothetical protein
VTASASSTSLTQTTAYPVRPAQSLKHAFEVQTPACASGGPRHCMRSALFQHTATSPLHFSMADLAVQTSVCVNASSHTKDSYCVGSFSIPRILLFCCSNRRFIVCGPVMVAVQRLISIMQPLHSQIHQGKDFTCHPTICAGLLMVLPWSSERKRPADGDASAHRLSVHQPRLHPVKVRISNAFWLWCAERNGR